MGAITRPSKHMPIEFVEESPLTGDIADKDYFLTVDGEIAQTDEDAHTLLIRKGQEMSKEVAKKIGKVAQPEESDEKADEAKADTPSENKKATPSKNKGVKN